MDIGPAASWSEIKNLIKVRAASVIDNIDNPSEIGAAAPIDEIKNSFRIEAAGLIDKIENPFEIEAAALLDEIRYLFEIRVAAPLECTLPSPIGFQWTLHRVHNYILLVLPAGLLRNSRNSTQVCFSTVYQ